MNSEMLSALDTLPQVGALPPFDLACVGTSICGLGAFTLEAYRCIAAADVVYYYPPSPKHLSLIRGINSNVIDVNATLYVPGAPFEPTYQAIVAEVLGTLKRGQRVAYAVQGSPAFHCGTAMRLCRIARARGLKVMIVSGISSLELLTAELSPSYDMTNLQIYGAARIVGGARIDPTVPCFIFDVGRFALPAVRRSSKSFVASRLRELQNRLVQIYPTTHSCLLMRITDNGNCASHPTLISELPTALIKFGSSVTIFIPPKIRALRSRLTGRKSSESRSRSRSILAT